MPDQIPKAPTLKEQEQLKIVDNSPARMARVFCHTCKILVCSKCLFLYHQENRENPWSFIMHDYEQIDDYVASVKQIVWMIN